MIQNVKDIANQRWDAWINKRTPTGNIQTLRSNTIYILPSAFGLVYAFIVFSLFSSAINYQISSIFLFTFLVIVIGLMSAWEAHGNLNDLTVQFISVTDVEANKPTQITLFIKPKHKIRFGIEFRASPISRILLDMIPPEGCECIIPLPTTQRGHFSLPRITVSTTYPFGLFRCWSYLLFEQQYYVYPEPVDPGFIPPSSVNTLEKSHPRAGDEEFYDLKEVSNPWIEPNRIAWKIVAKDQGWFLKNYDTKEGEWRIFSLNNMNGYDLELKLSYLTFWLQQSELNHEHYALQLYASTTAYGSGQQHLQQCLRQLAIYS